MISHLWKLPKARAADWRFNRMSVCICLLDPTGEHIVFIEDEKVTLGNFAADSAVRKNWILRSNWWIQYAGDDSDKARRVIQKAQDALDQTTDENIQQVVVKAVEDAFWDVLHEEITTKVLRRYGFTVGSFQDVGRKKLTTTVYNRICSQIEQVKLSLSFLIAGFDGEGNPHLWGVDSDGEVRCYDELKCWAIGSGSPAALSALAFQIEQRNLSISAASLEEIVYFACEAKFMAESNPYVGKVSSITIFSNDGKHPRWIFDDDIDKIRTQWLRYGAPRPALQVIENIPGMIFDTTRIKREIVDEK